MKRRDTFMRKALAFSLTLCLLLGVAPIGALAAGRAAAPSGYVMVQQTDYTLVDGVTETQVYLNNVAGTAQVAGYMVTVSPEAKAAFKVSYPGYYSAGSTVDSRRNWTKAWSLAKATDHAAAYEAVTGGRVIMATNGDCFNMQTGQPKGYLVMEGNAFQTTQYIREPFFALLNNGTYAIRDVDAETSDVVEAVSGPFFLVKDGVATTEFPSGWSNTELDVRNAVGLKEDGTVITFIADGRQSPYSVGMTLPQIASYMAAQGVQDALYLDGGGSASIASRHEGEEHLTIKDRPSDGVERLVSNALLLVYTGESSSTEFDHASVSPSNEYYTPGSSVAFSAVGVSASSRPAELPTSGLTWSLAEGSEALGNINAETGVFASNGTVGDVTVNLLYGEKVVGTSTISIQAPDELYFTAESVSMDFGETKDLGLVARYEKKELHYKDGDFVWSFSNEAIGSVSNNIFTASTGTETIVGIVTATYGDALSASIGVEIGKLPVVALDFEPIDGEPQRAAHFHWGYFNNHDDKTSYGSKPNNLGPYENSYYNSSHNILRVPYKNTSKSNNSSDWSYKEINGTNIQFTGNYDTDIPAAEIFREDGYQYYLWPNRTISTMNAGNLRTTNEADGGQVRFGEYSLELNFDYASYNGAANSNYYIRYCGERYIIEGMPTEVGVWVYADAETYNLNGYILATDFAYWNGSAYVNKNIYLYHDNVAEDGTTYQEDDIDWVGWKYCYAHLDGSSYHDNQGNVEHSFDFRSYYSEAHPYIIRCGEGVLWLCYQPAKEGGRYNGTLYFDNYRFSYGTNLDDLDNPVIDGIAIASGGSEVSLAADGSTVIASNSVDITARFHEYDGANASGIDATKTVLALDGEALPIDGSATSALSRITIPNGQHSLTVTVYDNFGNYSTTTRHFTVSNTDSTTASARVSGEETVTMGAPYELQVHSIGQVNSLQVNLYQLNSDFGQPTITPESGWTFDSSAYESTGFKKAKQVVEFRWTGGSDAPNDGKVATLQFNVPTEMDPEVDFFTYQVTGACTASGEAESRSFAQPKVTRSLSAYYSVEAGIAMQGKPVTLTVVGPSGAPVSGVTVNVNGTDIGTTDDNGAIVYNVPSDTTSLVVYARDNSGKLSFTKTISVMAYSADASPVAVTEIAAGNGSTEQLISWMSSPSATANKAVVKYSVTDDLSDAVTVEGKSTLRAFNASSSAAFINTVKITGLTPGTTYYYQAGDGEDGHWSATRTFKTVAESGDMKFFVLADTQMSGNTTTDAEAIKMLKEIGGRVSSYDFGIQSGDYIDSGANYVMWEEIQSIFSSAFAGIDIIHDLGNHEYMGDTEGLSAALIYDLNETKRPYFSVQYGDVYVACINNMVFGTIPTADLQRALDWLVEDAQAAKATWKVLVIHQPPYYTNVSGGNERVHEMVPAVAQAAGIDVVFSGHDHSYARTEAINGVTYFIGGDLGEKSRSANYAAVNNPEHHFAFVNQSYDALYLDVATSGEAMTITARNYNGDTIDAVTLNSKCSGGHEFQEYNPVTGKLICNRCGKEFDPSTENFTGFVTVKGTEKQMYFFNGAYKTGWFTVGDETCHFGDDGIKHETSTYNSTTCTTHGYIITTCLDCYRGGKTEQYASARQNPPGHTWDEKHVCTVCHTVGKDINTLDISAGTNFVWNGSAKIPLVTIKDGEKTLTRAVSIGSGEGEYYETTPPDTEVGTYEYTVEGLLDYYGTKTLSYNIVPPQVTNLEAVKGSDNSVTLTWDESHGATSYRIFDNGTERWIAETATLTIDGLGSGAHSFTVRAYANTLAALSASDSVSVTISAEASSSDDGRSSSTGGGSASGGSSGAGANRTGASRDNATSNTNNVTLNPNGSNTTTTTNRDGSITETTTAADGSKAETTTKTDVKTNSDGSTTATITETSTKAAADGSSTEAKSETSTTTRTNSDGSSTEATTTSITSMTKAADGSITETKSEVSSETTSTSTANADGTTTTAAEINATERKTETVTNTDGSKTEITTVTETTAERTAIVDKDGNGTVSEIKTETVTDADGNKLSETKTETATVIATDAVGTQTATATATAVTVDAEGNTTTTVTVTEDAVKADGTTSTTVSDGEGNTLSFEAKVSEAATENALKSGGPVQLPGSYKPVAPGSAYAAPSVALTMPKLSGTVKVEIETPTISYGNVAYLRGAGEKLTLIKTCTTGSVIVPIESSCELVIVDNTKTFSDVAANSWAKDAITFTTSREIFNGTGNDTFSPSSGMTRGMLMTILSRYAGEDAYGTDWQEKGMAWSMANGISDGTGPEESVTREQLVTMLWRYAGKPNPKATLSGYNDTGEVSEYATGAVAWAVENKVMNGYDGVLAPQSTATREQVAQFFMNFALMQ